MSLRVRNVAVVGVLLLSLAATRSARAADQPAAVGQISTLTKSALAAYGDGDVDKAKSQLLQAVALSKKDSDVAEHPVMARTYLLLGVVYIDGYEDRKSGMRYLGKALSISPDIDVPETLATKTVMKAFDEARASNGGSSAPAEASAAADSNDDKAEKPKTAREVREEKARSARDAKDEKESAAREAKEEKDNADRQTREEKEAAARAAQAEQQTAKAVAAEKKRAEADARERDRQAHEAKAQSDKELAQTRANEAKERAEKERIQKEKDDRDNQIREAKVALTDAKQRMQQLEKDNAEKDKTIAAGLDREKKEREAKEKLAQDKDKLTHEKADRDKTVADLQKQVQQLQKDKQDRDKTIAAGLDREKKEREAKEKLEHDRQLADARDKELKNQEDTARTEREKLAEGPDLPSRIGEPIYCALPDEAQAGADLFVHCAAQQVTKAKELALYYRPNGMAHYNSLTLTRSKKGWYTTVIPASHVNGKLLQYYVEARDARDTVTATNGKSNSPNVLTLKPASTVLAGGSGSSNGSFTEASAVSGKRQARSSATTRSKSR